MSIVTYRLFGQEKTMTFYNDIEYDDFISYLLKQGAEIIEEK